MGKSSNNMRVKYSAAYSTGRELMLEPRYGCAGEASLRRAASPKMSPKGLQRAAREPMRNRRGGYRLLGSMSSDCINDYYVNKLRPLWPLARPRMKCLTPLSKALQAPFFNKWAFCDLTEHDFDVGILAEYRVGNFLGGLPPSRKVNAPFNLATKFGVTIEVKATPHKQTQKGRPPYYRWDVSALSEAVTSNRPIADVWVFLIAAFSRATSVTSRMTWAFDLRNWSCCLVTGKQLRTTGCARYVSASTLRRRGVEVFPLEELKNEL